MKPTFILLFFIFLLEAIPVWAQDKTEWRDVTEWGVEGRGWADQERKRWFDRFPAKAEGKVTQAVWNLSRHSAGMMVRFKTDATTIRAKWKLLSARLGMPHMPPSGVSGLDLYARDAKGQWRWAAATKPNKQEMQVTLLRGIAPGVDTTAAANLLDVQTHYFLVYGMARHERARIGEVALVSRGDPINNNATRIVWVRRIDEIPS